MSSMPAIAHISDYAAVLQSIIYNYFATTFGTMTCSDDVLNTVTQKYNDCSPRQLRTALQMLKSAKSYQIDEICCVNRLLRKKIGAKKCSSTDPRATDSLDGRLKKNFWKTCRDVFKYVISPTPSFDVAACTKHFTGVLRRIGAVRRFKIPTWILVVPAATIPFDVSPPTYA